MRVGQVRRVVSASLVGVLLTQLAVVAGVVTLAGPAAAAQTVLTDPVLPPGAVDPPSRFHVVESSGPTEAPSSITQDTVWGPQGSPYIVRSSLHVPSNITLTLLPGTVVKMDSVFARKLVDGQLLSLGTPTDRVVITSYRDDTVMGDTNGDGDATSPAPGDWDRLTFRSSTGPSVLHYTEVRYGGWGSSSCGYSMVNVSGSGAHLTVANSTLSHSQWAAFRVTASARFVGLYGNHISNSSCTISTLNAADFEVIGNTLQGPAVLANSDRLRIRFNTVTGNLGYLWSSSRNPTGVDIRFNSLLGGVSGTPDYSRNWFGHDANQPLPSCLLPEVADEWVPALDTRWVMDVCPHGQKRVYGYAQSVLPALSEPPPATPSSVLEASAPGFGPVNTYTGALQFQSADLSVHDAGRVLTATRTYRSDRLSAGDAGFGWSSAFSESLSQDGDVFTMLLNDGSSLPFVTDPAAGYVPAPGVAAGFSSDESGTVVTAPDQTAYEFNAAGELTAMTLGDPGHRVEVTRAGGQVGRVTGESGRYLDFTRTDGRLSGFSDSAGRSAAMAYAGDRLVSVTGVDGEVEQYQYDAAGRLTQVLTPGSRVRLAAGYDGLGRVAWLNQLGSGVSTFDYDPVARRTTITLPDGTVMVHAYDWAGRLVAEQVDGIARHTVYDGHGRVVARVAGVPNVPMRGYSALASATAYDHRGDLVLATDATGARTRTTYNSTHRPLVTTRADGSTIVREYDAQGRLSSVTDPVGNVWSYTYNDRGQVTSQTDPLGRSRTVSYAANGDAESISDESGATTTFSSDAVGRRTSVIDPLGNQQQVSYTAWGEVSQATTARGAVTTAEFDADRLHVSTTDPLGAQTLYEYDSQGRLAAVVDPAGGRTEYDHDDLGRPVAVTGPQGAVSSWTYTPHGQVATATDPLGSVTSYSYDPAGRLYRITDALEQITQYWYDNAGRTTDVWTPDGARTRFTYDRLGRNTAVTTPRGRVWATEYDQAGRQVKWSDPTGRSAQASYDEAGRLASYTDQNGAITSYANDDTQRTVTITDEIGVVSHTTRDAAGRVVSVSNGLGHATGFSHDADGNVVSVADPTGGSWQFDYDLAGRLTGQLDPLQRASSLTYDSRGWVIQQTYPDSTTESYSYDQAGHPVSHIDRAGATWQYSYDDAGRLMAATDPLGAVTSYDYDPLGRQTRITDAAGVVTNTAYDPVGRPAVTWDASGASWVTVYDLDGNVIEHRDPAGLRHSYIRGARNVITRLEVSGNPVEYFQYDDVGNLTAARNWGDPWSQYEYDSRGRLTAHETPVGERTEFTYDDADRLTARTSPQGNTTSWAYDAAGRLTAATDPLGNSTSYTYDSAGQLTSATLPRGGVYNLTYNETGSILTETDPTGATTSYDYDPAGRLTSTTYPSGREVNAAYDLAGRLIGLSAGDHARSFEYDSAGRLTSAAVTEPAPGPVHTFEYDDRGLLVRTGDQFGHTDYTYFLSSRLQSVTTPGGPTTTYNYSRALLSRVDGAAVNYRFSYDQPGRLERRDTVQPTRYGTEVREYDDAGRLTRLTNPTYRGWFTYHPDGQIATRSTGGSTPKVTSYDYDDAGRLLSAVTTQGEETISTLAYTWDADGNRTSVTLDEQPPITADYDLAGRLISTSDGTTYTYDADGQLASQNQIDYTYTDFGELSTITTPETSVSHTRDALGRVATRSADGTTETYGYDRDSAAIALAQTDQEPTTVAIRKPHGTILAATTDGTTRQAFTNIHGDLTGWKAKTNTNVYWQAEYDPFGNPMSVTGTATLPLGFQAMRTDPDTGLVDMHARHYDAVTGRFTTPDTIIGAPPSPISLNRYLYGNADPINHTDPDGHWPKWLQHTANTVSDAVSGFAKSWSNDFRAGLQPDYKSDSAATRFVTSAIDAASGVVADTFRVAGVAASCAKQNHVSCNTIEQMFTWEGAKAAWHATADPIAQAWTSGTADDWGYATGTIAAMFIGGKGFGQRLDLPNHRLTPSTSQTALPAGPQRQALPAAPQRQALPAAPQQRALPATPQRQAIDAAPQRRAIEASPSRLAIGGTAPRAMIEPGRSTSFSLRSHPHPSNVHPTGTSTPGTSPINTGAQRRIDIGDLDTAQHFAKDHFEAIVRMNPDGSVASVQLPGAVAPGTAHPQTLQHPTIDVRPPQNVYASPVPGPDIVEAAAFFFTAAPAVAAVWWKKRHR